MLGVCNARWYVGSCVCAIDADSRGGWELQWLGPTRRFTAQHTLAGMCRCVAGVWGVCLEFLVLPTHQLGVFAVADWRLGGHLALLALVLLLLLMRHAGLSGTDGGVPEFVTNR